MGDLPLDIRAATHPNDIAIFDHLGAVTWSDLATQVERLAARFVSAVGDTGRRVAVLGDNAAPTLIAHLAGMRGGVGTVATARQLTPREMTDQFRDADVAGVVTGPGGLASAAEAARALGLFLVVHGAVPPAGSAPWSRWSEDDVFEGPEDIHLLARRTARAPMLYTSGTTGRARGTEVRWASPAGTAGEYVAAVAAGSGFPPGRHLVAGPLQHNGPLTCLRHLLAGEPVVIMERFDPEACLRLIHDFRSTSSVMVPTHFQRLLQLPEETRARYDVSSMRQLSHTGSACPPSVKRAMIEWFGPVLVESYGASEVGTLARIDSHEWLRHPGSVGRAVAPFEVLVVDEEGRPQPPGVVGRLAFRGPEDRGVRYHADPCKTRTAYIAAGTFTVGDIGYVDEDGYIFITDREADIVVSGGVNLYPAESEQVLVHHPAVADVAVIGVPDARFGESLLAIVVPRGEAPEPAELNAFCRRHLAAYKCPKRYEFRHELPRNPMGKIEKRALRQSYWGPDRKIAG